MQNNQFFRKNRVENHLATIFDDLPGFIYFVKDRELRYVAFNEKLCEIFESTKILGKRDDDFIPEHILKHIRQDDLRILESGQSITNRVELVPRGSGFVDWSTTTKKTSPRRQSRNLWHYWHHPPLRPRHHLAKQKRRTWGRSSTSLQTLPG